MKNKFKYGTNQNDANSSYNQKPNATIFNMKDSSRGARHFAHW